MKNETTIAAFAQFAQSIDTVKASWLQLKATTSAMQKATDDYLRDLNSVQRSAREAIESLQ